MRCMTIVGCQTPLGASWAVAKMRRKWNGLMKFSPSRSDPARSAGYGL